MKFNLKDWKKVKSESKYTILKNSEGHELKISHSSLSKKMMDQLDKLPEAMADGGEVRKKPEGGKYVDPKAAKQFVKGVESSGGFKSLAQYKDNIKKSLGFKDGGVVPNSIEEVEMSNDPDKPLIIEQIPEVAPQVIDAAKLAPQQQPQAPIVVEPIQQPAVVDVIPMSASASQPAPAQPSLAQEGPKVVKQAVEQQMPTAEEAVTSSGLQTIQAGIAAEQVALQRQAREEAKVLQQAAIKQEQVQSEFNANVNKLSQERLKVQQDIENNVIDPNRMFTKMDTGQKVSTVIGLILGGFGAAIGGGENLVKKSLDKQIDDDINAQKAELGKKENLLAANLKQYGNMRDAMDMTRVMQQDAISLKLKQAAAKAQDPLAKARLLQEAGKLELAQAPAVAKMAARKTVEQAMRAADKDPSRIPEVIDALKQVAPEQAKDMQDRYVPGMGVALTSKDADYLKDLKGTVDTALSGIKDLKSISNKPLKSLSPEDRAKADTVAGILKGVLRVPLVGPGAVSESERALIDSIVANPAKIFSLDSTTRIRLDTLEKKLQLGLDKAGESRGIKPKDPLAVLSPQQRKFADWAQKNPQDPRAQIILNKLGL